MTAVLVSPPAVEPVGLAEAKLHLRVDSASEDDRILGLVRSARSHVEDATGRVLIEQGWRIHRDAWPRAGIVRLAPAPLIAVDAVTVYDVDGVPRVLSPDAYAVDAASAPARLRLDSGAVAPGLAMNGIEIDVTAGYGPLADDVPTPLKQAILMLAAHWFEQREAAMMGVVSNEVAFGVSRLLARYRLVRLA